MYQQDPAIMNYGVKYQSRCIVSQTGEIEHTHFILGTLSLREENEVHVIRYSESSADLTCEGLYSHQHEIWDLAASPFDSRLLSTVYSKDGAKHGAIWRIPSKNSFYLRKGQIAPSLEPVVDIKGKNPISLLWFPKGRHDRVISLEKEGFFVWNFDQDQKSTRIEAESAVHLESESNSCGSWNPSDINSVATATETKIQCWDIRSMQKSHTVEKASSAQIRDIDYNPRNTHVLMSTGDDSKIRLWDLRNTTSPLAELHGHSHWTWKARFNPFFDELILSSGTDSVVNLWRVSSKLKGQAQGKSENESSYGSLSEAEGSLKPVQTFTEHEDSVYGLAWSSREPWIFASVSYDGRVVVSSIPDEIRHQVRG